MLGLAAVDRYRRPAGQFGRMPDQEVASYPVHEPRLERYPAGVQIGGMNSGSNRSIRGPLLFGRRGGRIGDGHRPTIWRVGRLRIGRPPEKADFTEGVGCGLMVAGAIAASEKVFADLFRAAEVVIRADSSFSFPAPSKLPKRPAESAKDIELVLSPSSGTDRMPAAARAMPGPASPGHRGGLNAKSVARRA